MFGQVVALIGSLFVLLAAVGVLRFGDPLARLHALGKASTLGVVLVFLGAAVTMETVNDWTNLVLAALLQLVTSPIAATLIARSTYLVMRRRAEASSG